MLTFIMGGRRCIKGPFIWNASWGGGKQTDTLINTMVGVCMYACVYIYMHTYIDTYILNYLNGLTLKIITRM